MSYHEAIGRLVITRRAHCLSFLLHIYILCSSYFCGIWALCVSWVTSNQFYYTPCLTCWALFGSLVPAICNHTSCAQEHELPWGHWWIGNNQEGTLHIVFLTIYTYATLTIYMYTVYNWHSCFPENFAKFLRTSPATTSTKKKESYQKNNFPSFMFRFNLMNSAIHPAIL